MPQRLDGIRVLLVEDDADGRDVMQSFIEYEGAYVVPAADGASALAALATMKPHVIVTDINMPTHDGFWFVHEARERGYLDGVPTMAVTALQLDRAKLEDAGFSAYLRKPIELDVLCSTVAASRDDARRLSSSAPNPMWFNGSSPIGRTAFIGLIAADAVEYAREHQA